VSAKRQNRDPNCADPVLTPRLPASVFSVTSCSIAFFHPVTP
jgi:hypothetical protein